MPSSFISEQARCADLILTNALYGPSALGGTRCLNLGDLILQAGRPVLIVPDNLEHIRVNRAVVAWKDTRERAEPWPTVFRSYVRPTM